MLLSVVESVIRKKHMCIPIGVLLSAAAFYLSFALNEYQYGVFIEAGVFNPKQVEVKACPEVDSFYAS